MSWWRNLLALPDRVACIHEKMEKFMADVSPVLNQLADDLSNWAAGPFAELLQENADLRAYKAAKEQEDVNEPAAAQRAVDAFNAFARPVSENPEVPTEIPPVEVPEPAEPVEGAPADEGDTTV